MVEAINQTGMTASLASELTALSAYSEWQAVAITGIGLAFLSNLANNLPVGLFAGGVVNAAHLSDRLAGAVLVGVDLGPNLSVTGSLATILWLSALRREGITVSAYTFLKVGAVVMIPALIASLAAL